MTFKLPIIHSPSSDVLTLLIRLGEHRHYETLFQHKYALLISFRFRYQQELSNYISDPAQCHEDRVAPAPSTLEQLKSISERLRDKCIRIG